MPEIAAQIAARLSMDAGEFVRGSKAAQREADRLQASLLHQQRVLQMGANEAKLYELSISGVSSEQVRAIRSMQAVNESLGGPGEAGGDGLIDKFNHLSKLAKGGGVLIGAKIIAHEFENVTEAIKVSADAGGDFTDKLLALGHALPIIGDIAKGFENIHEAITGAEADAKALASATKTINDAAAASQAIDRRAQLAEAGDDVAKATLQKNFELLDLEKKYQRELSDMQDSGQKERLKTQFQQDVMALNKIHDVAIEAARERAGFIGPAGPELPAPFEFGKDFHPKQFDMIGQAEKDFNEAADRVVQGIQQGVEIQNAILESDKQHRSEIPQAAELAVLGSATAVRMERMTFGQSVEDKQLEELKRHTEILKKIDTSDAITVADF